MCIGLKKSVGVTIFCLELPKIRENGENPYFAIGANAFCATNFRSRSAMRGAEIHGNMRRDITTCILSIGNV